MLPGRRRRIIRRLQRRIDRLEEALEYYENAEQHAGVRGKLLDWLGPRLEEAGIDLDANNDGFLDAEEADDAMDELVDLLDRKVALPEPYDTLMDLGVSVAANVIVAIVMKRPDRLKRRLERKRRRLEKLKAAQ